MTPEEQKAAETAAAEEAKNKADAEAAEAAAKAKAEEEANAKQDIDVKAELAKEKERREKAEKELADRDFKEREAKRKAKEEADKARLEDEGDRPVSTKDLQELEDRIYQKAQRELQGARIEEVAIGLSGGDADLAQLIIETHKNRTFPADLTLEGQMEEAFAIVHGRKSAAKASELARALRSKETASRSAPGTHHGEQMQDEPQLGSSEAQALKDAGMSWDPVKKAYKKSIQGGKKHYFFDPKSKKRWTE